MTATFVRMAPEVGVLGVEPLGEGVASNIVRARGRLPPQKKIFKKLYGHVDSGFLFCL